MSMSSTNIFRTYLERFTSGDTVGTAELLTDDFEFYSPLQESKGKEEFLQDAMARLAPIMRGFTMHQEWEHGDEVGVFYDFKIETPAGAGSIPMAEWITFRNGKLATARLIFDTAAMAALMPAH
jgi:ketosteroid isomerase-like protein